MSNSSPAPEEIEDYAADPSESGPAPHEDLTIGELIDSMRAKSEQRPGEQCFVNSAHERCWVPDREVERFVAEYGSEHPSAYRRDHGVDWQQDFFQLMTT